MWTLKRVIINAYIGITSIRFDLEVASAGQTKREFLSRDEKRVKKTVNDFFPVCSVRNTNMPQFFFAV